MTQLTRQEILDSRQSLIDGGFSESSKAVLAHDMALCVAQKEASNPHPLFAHLFNEAGKVI